MDSTNTPADQTTITYVLDFPNEAAEELDRLRKLHSALIADFASALSQLDAAMPQGADAIWNYARRCGYATATIRAALADLRAAQK